MSTLLMDIEFKIEQEDSTYKCKASVKTIVTLNEVFKSLPLDSTGR